MDGYGVLDYEMSESIERWLYSGVGMAWIEGRKGTMVYAYVDILLSSSMVSRPSLAILSIDSHTVIRS